MFPHHAEKRANLLIISDNPNLYAELIFMNILHYLRSNHQQSA